MEKSIIVNVTVNSNRDNQPVITEITAKTDSCSNENKENPFNYVGVLHNEYLDTSKKSEGSIDEIISDAKQYFNKKLNQEIPDITRIVEMAMNSSLSEIFVRENGFTDESCIYLNELNNILFKPRELSISAVIRNLKRLESKASNDNNLNRRDQEVILISLAIATNSLDYWDNLPDEDDNQPKALKPFWKKFWKVVAIAAVDIGAGALGVLVGGTIGGPAGGAAVGGAAAAAASKGAS